VLLAVGPLAAFLLGVYAPAQVVRVYLLALVAVAGAVFASRVLSRFGRLERYELWRKRVKDEPEMPRFFERAVRRIELANGSGVYFEQLRPRLREIAEQRLSGRGVRLASAEARQLLGEQVWLALERPPPGDKFAPPEQGQLREVIEALERV
jgi:hypothetical protein